MFSTSVSIFPSQNGSVFTCCRWQIFSWRQACYIMYMVIHHVIIYSETKVELVVSIEHLPSTILPQTLPPHHFLKRTYQQHTPFKSFQINQKITLISSYPAKFKTKYRSSQWISFHPPPCYPPRCRRGQNDRWNRASSAPRAKSEPWPAGCRWVGNDGKLSKKKSHQFDMVNI